MGFPEFEMALVPYKKCGKQHQECGNSEVLFQEGKNTEEIVVIAEL